MDRIFRFISRIFEIFSSSPTPEPSDPSDPCNAPACVDAKARLNVANNRFTSACLLLRSLNSLSKTLSQMLEVKWPSLNLLVAVVAIIILTLIGAWPALVAIILVALVVYGICWYLVIVIGRTMVSVAASLEEARTDIKVALEDVLVHCPESCRGELSNPECHLED